MPGNGHDLSETNFRIGGHAVGEGGCDAPVCAAIRNGRFTSIPAVPFAQIAVIGRRSTERIEPILSLPFEYWPAGGILWLAQHITSASTVFVLSRMMPGGCAMSETRKIAAISGLGCGRL